VIEVETPTVDERIEHNADDIDPTFSSAAKISRLSAIADLREYRG
jgi:hypothetical protein